jgi:hypothetical protein
VAVVGGVHVGVDVVESEGRLTFQALEMPAFEVATILRVGTVFSLDVEANVIEGIDTPTIYESTYLCPFP